MKASTLSATFVINVSQYSSIRAKELNSPLSFFASFLLIYYHPLIMTLFSKHFFTFTHDHHDYNHLIFQIMTFCKKKRAFSSRSSSSPASLPSSSSCAASFAAAETARANTRSVCQAKTKEKDKDKKTKVKFFMCHIICSSRNYQVNIYAKTKKKTKTKEKQILVELYSLSMSVQQYSFQHS